MRGIRGIQIALCAAALGLLASCAEMPTTPTTSSAPVAPTPPPGYWNGDGVPGSPKIVVSISEQRAYFYKGKNLVGESTVSTGKPGFSTPPGRYTVLWKNPDHVSTVFGDYVDEFGNVVKSNIDVRKDRKPPGSRYDGARMPFAMFFRGGYAMHQGYVPPYAASHGCIRLPEGMAETFFNAAPPGTPVVVKAEAVARSPIISPVDPATVAPPAPELVRYTAPASVPPPNVRSSTAPAPVRPATVRSSTAPATVRPPPVRSSTAPPTVPTATVRSSTAPATIRPAAVTSTAPAPASVTTRSQTRVISPAPAPVRSPAPASLRPAPTPVVSRTQRPVRSRTSGRLPTPTPTPTPRR
jgi:hypothetical protein